MRDVAAALAYLQPSSSVPFLAKRASSTGALLQWQRRDSSSEAAAAGVAAPGRRNHDPLRVQQGDDRRLRRRRRRACFSLSATIAGEDAATSRLGKRASGGAASAHDKDCRTRGQTRFAAMMQLLPPVAAKVNVARVMQQLRDEGSDINLRTYRGCLAFLAKGGRGREALMYLQEMEVSIMLHSKHDTCTTEAGCFPNCPSFVQYTYLWDARVFLVHHSCAAAVQPRGNEPVQR